MALGLSLKEPKETIAAIEALGSVVMQINPLFIDPVQA